MRCSFQNARHDVTVPRDAFVGILARIIRERFKPAADGWRGGGRGMGPPSTAHSVPVTRAAVPILGRCVVVARGGKGSEDPSPGPRRATRPVIELRVRE